MLRTAFAVRTEDHAPPGKSTTSVRPSLSLLRSSITGTTPRTAQDSQLIRISFDVHTEHAPALRSAVEEISNELGGRLEGMYTFPVEMALTNAVIALGTLRAAVCAKIPAGDANYRGRK
jgi:hypothetical protein